MAKIERTIHLTDGFLVHLEDVRHFVVLEVTCPLSPIGQKGDRLRLFLSDRGLDRIVEATKDKHIHLLAYAQVVKGQVCQAKRFDQKEDAVWLYLESKKL